MYDYLIVGGGISGLYTAFKLYKQKKNFLIIEQKGRIGGRIKTIEVNNIKYDSGALRININHKLLLKLIDELNLSSDLIDFTKKIKYFINNSFIKTKNNELNYILKKGNNINSNIKKSNSIKGIGNLINFDKSKMAQIKFGYDSSFNNFNFKNFLQNHKFYIDKYYILNNGLIQICNKIIDIIGKDNIRMKTKLYDINYNNKKFTVITDKKKIICKNVILFIPKINIIEINFLNKI